MDNGPLQQRISRRYVTLSKVNLDARLLTYEAEASIYGERHLCLADRDAPLSLDIGIEGKSQQKRFSHRYELELLH